MDFGFLLLAVFLIYIVAVKKQDARRKKRTMPLPKRAKTRTQRTETKNASPNPDKRTKPAAANSAPHVKEASFDVENFRAKLRIAWGEKETEEKSVAFPEEKQEAPVPVRVPVSPKKSSTVSSVSTVSAVVSAAETEERRQRAEDAKRTKRMAPREVEPIGVFDGESASEAMRRWVRYNAVLGKPRSRERWQSPVHKSC